MTDARTSLISSQKMTWPETQLLAARAGFTTLKTGTFLAKAQSRKQQCTPWSVYSHSQSSIRANTHTHAHTYAHTHTHACMHAHTHTHTHIHAHTHQPRRCIPPTPISGYCQSDKQWNRFKINVGEIVVKQHCLTCWFICLCCHISCCKHAYHKSRAALRLFCCWWSEI